MCVCLCSEGETSEENKNDSTTERNFPFVNQVTKEKLRPLPYFCKKIENCILVAYTHEVMTDKLNGWGHARPLQTFPLPPTVRLEPQAIAKKLYKLK